MAVPDPERCASCGSDLPELLPEMGPVVCRCRGGTRPPVTNEIMELVVERHMKAYRDGGSIYDDGDPMGERVVTVWKDRNGYRFHNLRPTTVTPAAEFGSWTINLRWSRLEFLTLPADGQIVGEHDRDGDQIHRE